MNELFGQLLTSTLETLYMVGVSALFGAGGGLALGILLVVSAPSGVLAAPLFHKVLTVMTNLGRSIPFIIIVVAIVPFHAPDNWNVHRHRRGYRASCRWRNSLRRPSSGKRPD